MPRSNFYHPWLGAFSITQYFGNWAPRRAVLNAIFSLSVLSFSSCGIHAAEQVAHRREDYHYSACYMFSESLCAHISLTHCIKIRVKKCKRDLWPSIYCSSACSCQKYLVFLQVWKHMKNSCTGSQKGRQETSRGWYTRTQESKVCGTSADFTHARKKFWLLLQKNWKH